METFNEKIKRVRKSLGLNQTDVCSKIGITQPSFASIEAGRTKSVSIELGKKIADALDISFNELFEIENVGARESLTGEIEQLKRRIIELEEQLNDKRSIIQFLSANDLLFDVAIALDVQSGEYHERRAKNTLDDMLNGTEIKPPYDRENRESLVKYISERIKNWPGPQNK